MAGSSLLRLLSDLAEDPQKLAKFRDSPDDVLGEYDLSDEQKKLIHSSLASNRQDDLLKAVGDEIQQKYKVGGVVVLC